MTFQPREASQIESAPSPLPTSSAPLPGGRPAAVATSCGLGSPLQTRSPDPYRSIPRREHFIWLVALLGCAVRAAISRATDRAELRLLR
ncbi:hypothetical protein Arub01_43140 [Actinomadura rubrobrunea]|uniref:Uncharacterized protein n=1 Tax=Actinomadura rubrobrunea TaxID=115335 RepID=A0A9W6PX80_9ACTN|nr:hypothetical protein Arub01_43140 [Actinomadura rubrobrunea]